MKHSNHKQPPESFNVGTLLTTDVYRIPMYQRNYAWEEGEITQLIQDVEDYRRQHSDALYYIGTLVVFKREAIAQGKEAAYETIDGQQRLTTLTLLAAWLKNYKVVPESSNFWREHHNLAFNNREKSRQTLDAIFSDKVNDLAEDSRNPALLNGYRIIEQVLPKTIQQVCYCEFAKYFFEKVQIMRVEVPHDTDLNHYFEIMNSRGEQLEKHEVLKARLLSVLEDGITNTIEKAQSKACLNLIWEACANMEKYVQTGFTVDLRDAVFGKENWGVLSATDFDSLCRKLNPVQAIEGSGDQADKPRKLTDIIANLSSRSGEQGKNQDEAPQRFNSVINFPNFLLQVLRIYLNSLKDDFSKSPVEIPLDDKRLLDVFEKHLLNDQDKVLRVKNFAFALLRCKYLYDHYVIKREFIKGIDGWSLKRYKWNKDNKPSYVNTFGSEDDGGPENRKILMLLAAFHVSNPTQSYKHWLSGTLNWLYSQPRPVFADYILALESLANAFMRDRFLITTDKKEYSAIIFASKEQPESDCVDKDTWVQCLSYGSIENNFVFNYLDYLLWKENESKINKVQKIADFEFTFRSSVEHFYPRHPLPGHALWETSNLDAFGNLCLISHAKNSRLSNNMPKAKKEHYAKGAIDSIKQYRMMQEMENDGDWSVQKMYEHQGAMCEIISNALNG